LILNINPPLNPGAQIGIYPVKPTSDPQVSKHRLPPAAVIGRARLVCNLIAIFDLAKTFKHPKNIDFKIRI